MIACSMVRVFMSGLIPFLNQLITSAPLVPYTYHRLWPPNLHQEFSWKQWMHVEGLQKFLTGQMRDADIISSSICDKSLYSTWKKMKKAHWSVMIPVSCRSFDYWAGEDLSDHAVPPPVWSTMFLYRKPTRNVPNLFLNTISESDPGSSVESIFPSSNCLSAKKCFLLSNSDLLFLNS